MKLPNRIQSLASLAPARSRFVLLGSSLAMLSAAEADTLYWDGETDGTWADASNWDTTGTGGGDPTNPPGAADNARFNSAGGGNTTIDLGTGQAVTDLEFRDVGIGAYTIGVGLVDSQTLGVEGIKMGAGADADQLINATVELQGPAVFQNYSGAGIFTVAGQITEVVAGTQLLLQGTNRIDLTSTANDGAGGYAGQTILQNGITVNAESLSESNLRIRQGTLTLSNDQGFADIFLGDDLGNGAADGVSTLNIGASNTIDLVNGEDISYQANTTDSFGNTGLISGGTLQLNSGGNNNVIDVEDNAQVSGAELTISSTITGVLATNDLRKDGAGTLRINGTDHSYGGRFVLREGTVQVEDASALGQKQIFSGQGQGDVTIDFVGAGDTTLNEDFRLGDYSGTVNSSSDGVSILGNKESGSRVVVAGSLNTNTSPDVARTLTLGGENGGENEVSGGLSDINATGGVTSLVKQGAGRWILSGDNDFTGTTTIEAGRLQLDDTTALYGGDTGSYTEGNITVESGATLVFDFDGPGNTWNPFGGGSNTRFFDVFQQLDDVGPGGFEAGSFLGIDVSSGDKLLNQTLTDTGDGVLGLVKTGGGVLRMNQNQTYTGDTLIEGGSIELEGGGGGGTLAGDVVISSGASLVFDKNGDYTLGGTVHGGGSVETSSTSTAVVTLGGGNTYTGGTNVNGGTLLINGDNSAATGAVTVAGGATLGGSGTIGGDTTFEDGATHAVGNSPGLQTFNGTVNYNQNSIFDWELVANTTANRGTDWDAVNGSASHDLNINPNAVFNIILDGSDNGGSSAVDFANAFWSAPGGQSWEVFSGFQSVSDLFSLGSVTVDSIGQDYATYGSFSLSADSGSLSLNWTPVPEPTSALAGLLLGAGLLRRRRRVEG